ncbi:hypothetical protein GALMADRAFT_144994 [Galerina marginata CBS 339.88]|uniref:Heme peroxidase n=1 Tax=Galerina marginata (strain CBS 339.88) TaxID=685588 RepID=A0A067ST87_GALM3|nr:hypothetical protein GALMADRAFT_144994 [Galerina marginata CBS 339.88]
MFSMKKSSVLLDPRAELLAAIRSTPVQEGEPITFLQKESKTAISLFHKSGCPQAESRLPERLPPADIVFKELLKSNTGNDGHPNGISSLAYAFLSLVNLSVGVSPHFDLYPLYGGKPSDFDKIRLKDGHGMLSPDCFFDNRLLFLPRASSVLLILFNRNHNYIARRLLLHTETPADMGVSTDGVISEALSLQDNEIFEKARHINCGHFRNILLEDIFKPLLGLPPVGHSHRLDLLSEPEPKGVNAVGEGFTSFVESTLLYDMSAIMSREDIQYFEKTLQEFFNDDPDRITTAALDDAIEDLASTMGASKRNRDCAGLQRQEGGKFLDTDLSKILHDGTESLARSTGQGIPSCQRIMQIKNIERARAARKPQACSFNEYRRFLGLKALESFQQWNSDPKVADSAEKLYHSIDNLEVYVGLEAEATDNDSGFRFGFTKTYALLVDIVSRIRSDPALTKNATENNLTKWGYADFYPIWNKKAIPEKGSFGAWLPKLLQRTLPHEYSYNNIYCLFPLSVPSREEKARGRLLKGSVFTNTVEVLSGLKLISMYDTQRPQPPKVHHLITNEGISYVFNQPKWFPTLYGDKLDVLTDGYGHDQDQLMTLHALIPDSGALTRYAEQLANMADEYIYEDPKITPSDGELDDIAQLDVSKDLINAVCTRWVSETLLDYPLKRQFGRQAKDRVRLLDYFLDDFKWIMELIINLIVQRFGLNDEKKETILKVLRAAGDIVHRILPLLLQEPEVRPEELVEQHEKLATLYQFVFQDIGSEDAWGCHQKALKTSSALSKHILDKLPPPSRISKQFFLIDIIKDFGSFTTRILKELTIGTSLPEQTAQTFLDRAVNANRSIPPHRDDQKQTARPSSLSHDQDIKTTGDTATKEVAIKQRDPKKKEDDKKEIAAKKEKEANHRVVANVLGLAVVASVKYSKVCTQAVDFYLQDKYVEECRKIVEFSNIRTKESKAELMGYIREAYRLSHPLGLWQNAAETTIIQQGSGLPDIRVNQGDKIYANFSKALTNPSDFKDPMKVDPKRQTKGMYGLGLHKCPGSSFVDETMPEIFAAIFRLKNIRRAPGIHGSLVRFNNDSGPLDTSSILFLNAEKKLNPYPMTLNLVYNRLKNAPIQHSKAKASKEDWDKVDREPLPAVRTKVNWVSGVIVSVLLLFLYLIFIMCRTAVLHALTSFWSLTHPDLLSTLPGACLASTASVLPSVSSTIASQSPPALPHSPLPTTAPGLKCLEPTKPIHGWTIHTMEVGLDGNLIPLEYTLDHARAHTAHTLSTLDVDAKDLRMVFYVDNELVGQSGEVSLNKSETCGEVSECLGKGFSGGRIVVPKGKHTVRIEGKTIEEPGLDGRLDWGEEKWRRLLWSRDSCAE